MSIARISVIIPYHNEEDIVNRAISSVVAQECPGTVEIVVVDDASDRPPPIADEHRQRVQVVRSDRPLHAAGARNLGIRESDGDVVCFLDADDVYEPGRLSSRFEFLDQHPEVVMLGGKYVARRDASYVQVPKVILEWYPQLLEKTCVLPEDIRQNICLKYAFHTNEISIRRGALVEVDGFEDSYRWAAEWTSRSDWLNLDVSDTFLWLAQRTSAAKTASPPPCAPRNFPVAQGCIEIGESRLPIYRRHTGERLDNSSIDSCYLLPKFTWNRKTEVAMHFAAHYVPSDPE